MAGWTLEDFRDKRDALWLAELGAWLHNAGKLHSDFQPSEGYNYRNPTGWLVGDPDRRARIQAARLSVPKGCTRALALLEEGQAKFADILPQGWLNEEQIALGVPFEDVPRASIAELIELQDIAWHGYAEMQPVLGRKSSKLAQLLRESHGRASNAEKEGNEADRRLQQGRKKDERYISTAFGYETELGIPEELWRVFGVDVAGRAACFQDRKKTVEEAGKAFRGWISEPNWPVNDVTLFDISSAAAAFFKAAITKSLLEGRFPLRAGWECEKPEVENLSLLRWRVMRVAVDGARFYGEVARVPDLVARRKLIDVFLDGIRQELEVETPVANEIYRDDSGACFLVPELTGDADGRQWREFVQPALDRGMLRAGIDLAAELQPRVVLTEPDALGLGMGQALSDRGTPVQGVAQHLERWWADRRDAICGVCGVRPVAPDGNAEEKRARARGQCSLCAERRIRRSEEWCKDPNETIWIDEAADRNGRVALVSGRFDLTPWLQPKKDSEIERAFFTAGREVDGIWEKKKRQQNATFARMRRVWETTAQFWRTVLGEWRGAERLGRIALKFRCVNAAPEAHNAYYLKAAGMRMSVVYDRRRDRLVSAENLERLALQTDWDGRGDFREFLAKRLRTKSASLEEPTGYGSANRDAGQIEIQDVELDDLTYRPVISILEEPARFQVIVPATEALSLVEAVRRKYQVEMGKVRHRLPLGLGIVFAPSATPLHAVIDAGRRMMERPLSQAEWTLAADVGEPDDREAVTLHWSNGREWKVPIRMKNGKALDLWHSYYEVPGEDGAVLAWQLKQGQSVRVKPSWVDFEFVESSGERFSVAYDGGGRRRGALREQRPILLEDVQILRLAWEALAGGVETGQAQWLLGTLAEARLRWTARPGSDEYAVWENYGLWCLRQLNWTTDERREQGIRTLDAVHRDGLLLDALELYLRVMKERPGQRAEETPEPVPVGRGN